MTQGTDGRLVAAPQEGSASGQVGGLPIARLVVMFIVYETCFYVAYRYGMSFSHATASPFWFPDSVLLCALLLAPTRWWWALLLGPLPIRLLFPGTAEVPHWFLLDAYLIDTAKGVVSALALRRFVSDPLQLKTIRDFGVYCLIAVLLVPGMGAYAGASLRALIGHDFWTSWDQWFLGNVLTHLVVTPAILWGIPATVKALVDPGPKRWIEGMALAAGLGASGYVAFHLPPGADGFSDPLFYAPVPFLFWAAIRFGMAGASCSILALTFISVEAALLQIGPFAGRPPGDTAVALQHFLLIRAAPLYLVALLIQQKQSAELGLAQSERRYREVVDSQAELVCRFFPDGRLSFMNMAFCRAFQRSCESLVGSDFVALLPEDSRELAREQIAGAASRGALGEWDCQVTQAGGVPGWQHWVCRPIVGPHGRVEELQALGHDVTDRKRAEEADRSLAHTSRLAVMGELTAMVAHEINQPLGAILSNAEAAVMMLDAKDPPIDAIREILSDILQSDLRASEAIARINALMRKREVSLAPMDINEAVADVLRLSAGDVLRRRVEVRSDLGRMLPSVMADRVQIEQILLNLFVNAMDAMKDTAPADRMLGISTRRDGDSIEVVVSDTGHGIAPDKLTGVFDSFYTTKPSGMGLGLSIARSILRTHRGNIWAENRAGGGAAFHFTLPVAAP